MSSRSCRTPSTISTTRRPASSRSMPRASIVLSQRHARPNGSTTISRRSAPAGSSSTDIVAGARRGAAHHARGGARRSEDRSARHRPQDPQRAHAAGAAVPQGRVRGRWRAGPLAHARAQPRARRRTSTRSAPPKCASCASSTTPRWRSRPSTSRAGSSRSNARFARLFHAALKGDGTDGRSILGGRRRARPRRARSRDPQGGGQAGRDRAGRRRARRRRASALPASTSPRSRTKSATRRRRSSTRSRPPSSARSRTSSPSRRRWRWSASSPAASRTTSTTCSAPS